MAIHLTSLRPAVVRLPPAPSRSSVHLAVTSQTRTSSTPATGADPAADFRALFGGTAAASTTTRPAPATAAQPPTTTTVSPTTATTATTANANAAPTVESVFGSNPWMTNPTGISAYGASYSYNPIYFATAATAQKVAAMVGGTVVQDNEFTKNTSGNPFQQNQPNNMVQLSNGTLVNPGVIASFYTHGYPQWMVDQMVANEVGTGAKTAT